MSILINACFSLLLINLVLEEKKFVLSSFFFYLLKYFPCILFIFVYFDYYAHFFHVIHLYSDK